MPFFQDPPKVPDLYLVDEPLKAELKRRVPADALARATPALRAMGRATTDELVRLSDQAEREPPEHVPYSPWGVRVDEIRTSRAWDEHKVFAAKHGIVATGYDKSYGSARRVVQAALLDVYSASSAIFSCPLAMTDAAARVLLDIAPPSVRDRLVPRLTSTDPGSFITSGQWMTERTGGSDVGGTETIAKPHDKHAEVERYRLYGTKWFTSATTSEMALTLARIDDGTAPLVAGSKGLSLFLVELERTPGQGLAGIQVNRLKDKLGTRALPTAELTLDGVVATRLGTPGRGVPDIATMLNVTRLYNAICSVSGMTKATALAFDYAERRKAFGKKLIDHALHRRTLDDMRAVAAGATALAFEIADLYGRFEDGQLDDEDRRRLRALIPIAKLTTGKQAVALASEALEAFGGAGYVEDTGLPRLLRDAQVLAIWEGTTNVLSLDVLRAEAKDGGFRMLVADLKKRLDALPATLDGRARDVVHQALGRLIDTANDLGAIEGRARGLAMTAGLIAEATYLGEQARFADDDGGARFTSFVRSTLAAPLQLA